MVPVRSGTVTRRQEEEEKNMIDPKHLLLPCGAILVGPNRILCSEAEGHGGPHKSKEHTQKEFDDKWAGPAGTRQIHWSDELCVKKISGKNL